MFKEKFQGSLETAYYSVGSNPLGNWALQCPESSIRTIQDESLKSNVLQLQSQNVATCSITTPVDPKGSLGIRLSYLTVLVKNLGRHFSFEVTILDNENFRRRYRLSSYLKETRISTFVSCMPLCLSEGWNQVQLNLARFTERMFGTVYMETIRIQVHANCRLRRVYFSDQLYPDDQLPNEYRLQRTLSVRPKLKSTLKSKPAEKKKTVSDG